ncbi:uncharacterized protein [Cherax quadricarinatus]|uniref:uncharacterized protein n=1 Tax=Cherax quadricarinatus TaxID=27406 RepID=UPI00387EDEBA
MVSQLFSGITQSLQGGSSPQFSPTLVPAAISSKNFFIDFSLQDQPLGRIVIKVLEGTGQLGSEFEALLTGRNGFGYKGSRVFACCQNEWILLGDLLYDAPRSLPPQRHYWDPLENDDGDEDEREGTHFVRDRKKSFDSEACPRILHNGYIGVAEEQDTGYRDLRGAVVAVAADFDLGTMTWILGPQMKICLNDSLIRSGRVLGQVTEGMQVAQQISQMSEHGNFEPSARINIRDCGLC